MEPAPLEEPAPDLRDKTEPLVEPAPLKEPVPADKMEANDSDSCYGTEAAQQMWKARRGRGPNGQHVSMRRGSRS